MLEENKIYIKKIIKKLLINLNSKKKKKMKQNSKS